MLHVGRCVTKSDDELKKINIDYLYHGIKSPKPEVISHINRLRVVRELDAKQYASQKKQLPYFVCGHFNPPFRHTENFSYVQYFVMDIDKISEKGLSIQDTRQKIEADQRVMMCFLSPGEDGLKVLFRLKERCMDAGLYSLFYKSFIKQFSVAYGLEQVVDARTSDVARACFISIDPDVYYNPEAQAIDINSFVDIHNPAELFEMKHSQEKEEKTSPTVSAPSPDMGPDDETVQRIKAILNPKARTTHKSLPYVPEQLNEIISDLKTYIEQTGAIVTEIVNISYGKKIRIKIGIKQAEINLFFGKKGYSVVKSPRTGTSEEMNELMSGLVNSFLFEYS